MSINLRNLTILREFFGQRRRFLYVRCYSDNFSVCRWEKHLWKQAFLAPLKLCRPDLCSCHFGRVTVSEDYRSLFSNYSWTFWGSLSQCATASRSEAGNCDRVSAISSEMVNRYRRTGCGMCNMEFAEWIWVQLVLFLLNPDGRIFLTWREARKINHRGPTWVQDPSACVPQINWIPTRLESDLQYLDVITRPLSTRFTREASVHGTQEDPHRNQFFDLQVTSSIMDA